MRISKQININNSDVNSEFGFLGSSREGLKRKSFVEWNGAKIEAKSPTEFTKNVVFPKNVQNEGTPK